MIVQCADCKIRYRLQPELVPPQRIKVRCMRCDHVFAIDGREADRPAAAPPRVSGPAAAVDPGRFGDLELQPESVAPPSRPSRPVRPASGPVEAASGSSSRVAMDLEIERASHAPLGRGPARRAVSGPATAVETPVAPPRAPFQEVDLDAPVPEAKAEAAPAPASAPERREKDKARRLARALVSDILVYNRDKRDHALKQGNLVQVLGPEIKKSWEVYKERVTPEVANSTNHFREALNEILAEGQPIF